METRVYNVNFTNMDNIPTAYCRPADVAEMEATYEHEINKLEDKLSKATEIIQNVKDSVVTVEQNRIEIMEIDEGDINYSAILEFFDPAGGPA